MIKITLLSLAYIGILTVGICNIKTESTYYLPDCKVIETHKEVITCVDKTDNVWEFKSNDYYQCGKEITLVISDNGTPDKITDDKIKEVRK